MKLYVAVMTFAGHAEGLEEFTERLWAALDGDKEAQREIRGASPTIIGCGEVGQTDDV